MEKGKKGVYFILPKEAHSKFKNVALRKRTTMTALLLKFISKL